MDVVIALDAGTTGVRTIAYSSSAGILASSYLPIGQQLPLPGRVEQDPVEIWRKQKHTLDEVLSRVSADGHTVCGLGITNQRETILIWDARDGRPLHNALVWQDRRTVDRCRRLNEGGAGALVLQKTGLPLDSFFSATKLEWLLDNVDGARELAQNGHVRAGTIDSWILWNLTNGAVHATDTTNASRTLLFHTESLTWDEELLELFRIPSSILPVVKETVDDFGTASALTEGSSIAIRALVGDQQAALFGQGCLTPGDTRASFGTAGNVMMNVGSEPSVGDGRLANGLAWVIDRRPTYCLEGVILIAGAAVQWLRDDLGLIEGGDSTVDPGECAPLVQRPVFVPAFAGLASPYWDPEARAAFLGVERSTTRADMIAAVIDGVAHQTVDVVETMGERSGFDIGQIAIDGGMAKNDYLMRSLSDFSGLAVYRPEDVETTVRGAAQLAAIGAGLMPLGIHPSSTNTGRRVVPSIEVAERAAARARWKKAINRTVRSRENH